MSGNTRFIGYDAQAWFSEQSVKQIQNYEKVLRYSLQRLFSSQCCRVLIQEDFCLATVPEVLYTLQQDASFDFVA